MRDRLSVVCWKWGAKYAPVHVNRLRCMVFRHLRTPHEFICITDDPEGIDEFTTVIPLAMFGPRLGHCLHRLNIFGPAADAIRGDWILQVDLDTVIADSLDPLLSFQHDMTIWKCPSIGRHGFALNPSFMLFRRAAHFGFWQTVSSDLRGVRLCAAQSGWTGSDQAVVSYSFNGKCRTLGESDGLISYRDSDAVRKSADLPPGVRLVGFYGAFDPSDSELQAKHKWIHRHWRS